METQQSTGREAESVCKHMSSTDPPNPLARDISNQDLWRTTRKHQENEVAMDRTHSLRIQIALSANLLTGTHKAREDEEDLSLHRVKRWTKSSRPYPCSGMNLKQVLRTDQGGEK